VLFLDIEGFTTLSEKMPPEDVVGTLNDFYGAASVPIAQRDGVVNQFLGDAIVATFNAPRRPSARGARGRGGAGDRRAVRRARSGRAPATVRIGVNTGPMTCGLLGTRPARTR
jgi:class 3 adenylate cyclase